MSIVESPGVLLRKTELRETSLILDFYTRESGRVRGVIKGVRSPQPQFGALFEIFSLDRVTYYERRNRDIYIISQCELVDYFPEIRKDLEKLGYASYFVELIGRTCETGERNDAIYDLLVGSLKALSGGGSVKRITRVFEIKLLKALGIMPRIRHCINCDSVDDSGRARFSVRGGGVLCGGCLDADKDARPILPGTVNFIDSVAEMPLDRVSRVKVSSLVGMEVEKLMRVFLDFYVQNRFKSVEFLKNVGVLL
ncbi:MAG: DNA repair protein RecO [Candidatus Omnitrophota bacterium]